MPKPLLFDAPFCVASEQREVLHQFSAEPFALGPEVQSDGCVRVTQHNDQYEISECDVIVVIGVQLENRICTHTTHGRESCFLQRAVKLVATSHPLRT